MEQALIGGERFCFYARRTVESQLILLSSTDPLSIYILFKHLHWDNLPEWKHGGNLYAGRTTLHFLPSSSSSAGLFWGAVPASEPGLLPLARDAWLGERRLGFLWVFLSSDTCFRPAPRHRRMGGFQDEEEVENESLLSLVGVTSSG